MKKTVLFLLLITTITYGQTQKTQEDTKILIPYRVKNLWGLSDTLGNIKVQPAYKEIKDFHIAYNKKRSSRYVVKTNKNYFVINRSKKVFLPETNTYDSILISRSDINQFYVFKKGKAGLYTNGKELIPCLYDEIHPTHNSSFVVKKGKFAGLLNSSGKTIIPVEYDRIHPSYEDKDQNKPQFIWKAKGFFTDKEFSDVKVKKTSQESESSAGMVELMDAKEADLDIDAIAHKLGKIYRFVDVDRYRKFAFVGKDKKTGVIDLRTESFIINPEYDYIMFSGEDHDKKIFEVVNNKKYGLVKEGNIFLLPVEYDKITSSYELGALLLKKDNKTGLYIFNTSYPFIPAKYEAIKKSMPIQINDTWQFGLFKVETEKGEGYVGENGIEFFKN
ncbi:WG repeat-containing protein [Flavobacterium pedocola]